MLTYYLVLNVPFDASDEDIRNRYLQMVKKHTPENDPERFRKITEAYEAIQTERKRIASKLFGSFNVKDYEEALLSLVEAREVKRRGATLHELFQSEKNS
ncbi:DnaJ domain-containing protein [Desulfonema limicola]|uniref:DnaJ domain-containing protein n=1 Tax=Desulfonema limicola TaxID=45656 RepID=A0A975GIP1_9BACT|nr:DnaJ domain-containing protein [Desulfonema limicola]QTA82138.1 DnaJ domain-containing protein [Desulfonema limicola]